MRKDQYWDAIRQRVQCDQIVSFDSSGRAECVQGNSHSPSMMWWKRTNTWYCFKCHLGGDVIDLYAHANGVGKKVAAMALAKDYKIAIAPDDERKMQLAATVDVMFIDFARICHDNLKKSPLWDIEIKKRGFTEATMEMFQVGLLDKDIMRYMDVKYSKDDMKRAGFLNEEGHWFCGKRMVYPYIGLSKQPIYFIYRIIPGEPDFNERAKYLKQMVSISDIVENQLFGLNSLSIHEKDVVIIAEGITDAMNVIQAGFPCISAVTTRFRREDFEAVAAYCQKFKKVIVLNDNDASGDSGTADSVKFLLSHAIPVYAGQVPLPKTKECMKCRHWIADQDNPGASCCESLCNPAEASFCTGFEVVQGFDLNDFLRAIPVDQHAVEVQKIIDVSIPGLRFLFDKLSSTATQSEIEEVVKYIPHGDVIMTRDAVDIMTMKFFFSKQEAKKIIKIAHGDKDKKAGIGSPAWEEIKIDIINNSPHLFLSNGLKSEGYWIKYLDPLHSCYQMGVHKELMNLIRKALSEIGMHGTHMVNEMIAQLEEAKNCTMADFRADREIIHYRNCIYFIREDKIIPRTMLEIPYELQKHKIKTFHVIPTDLILEGPVDAPRFTKEVMEALGDQYALTGIDPSCWKFTWSELFSDAIYIYEFERHLHRALDNPQYPGQYDRFWEWLGFCHTDMINKKAMVMRGVPNTGKTTTYEIYLNTLGRPAERRENQLGDDCLYCEISLHSLCDPKDKETTGALFGKKVCYDDDLGDKVIRDFERFKQRTGHEQMSVRFLWANPFIGDMTAKYVAGANVLPPVARLNLSFAIRWIPFFFDNELDEDEQDKPLISSMKISKVLLEYIVRKAHFAFKRLYSRGLKFEGMTPAEVLHWWRMESDSVYAFIEKCCDKVKNVQESAVQSDLYTAYVKFKEVCDISDKYVDSQTDFTNRLKNFGIHTRPGGKRLRHDKDKNEDDWVSVRVYLGVALNEAKLIETLGGEGMGDLEGSGALEDLGGLTPKTMVKKQKNSLDSHMVAAGMMTATQSEDQIKDLVLEVMDEGDLSTNDINVKLSERIKEVNSELAKEDKMNPLTLKELTQMLKVLKNDGMVDDVESVGEEGGIVKWKMKLESK